MSTTVSRALRTEVLEDGAQLHALQPAWERLWREDPRATPFQSPQWLLPWWRHVGQGQLRAIALHDECGELVGLAPLYVYTDASDRRHLFPVGIGTTDYLGLLARPSCASSVGDAVLAQVARWRERWDILEWPQLRAGDPLLAAAPVQAVAGEPHPVLSLGAGLPAIPKSTLANLRTCRNRAARCGTLRFACAEADEIPAALDTLARLHARRWSKRGLPGVLADPAVRAFHAEAAPLLQAAGLLRLHALHLDGACIAVLYALFDPVHERRCHYYLGGFDPRHAFVSPGTLLLAHAIEQTTAEGALAFDFLRGAEAYKYRWGAVNQPMFTLRMSSRAALTPPASAHPA